MTFFDKNGKCDVTGWGAVTITADRRKCWNNFVDFEQLLRQMWDTLVDRLYHTGNFLQNNVSCYSETLQEKETNDNPFESPIK